MAFKTVNQLTQSVISLVGLVTGTGVQTYTEPQVYAAIQAQFDILFIKRFWEWLTPTVSMALDGTTGVVTGTLTTYFNDPTDIKDIWINGTDRRVVPPLDREHLRASGSNAQYYKMMLWNDPLIATKLLQFYPITATDTLDITGRTKPAAFAPTSTVPFPDVVMTQAAAWHLLDNDGINPTASAKAQLLFETSYRDLIANLGEDVIGHGANRYHDNFTIRTL